MKTHIELIFETLTAQGKPMSSREIGAVCGREPKLLQSALKDFRAAGGKPNIYIDSWDVHPANGIPVALFAIGNRTDCEKPLSKVAQAMQDMPEEVLAARERKRMLKDANRDIAAILPTLSRYRGNPFAAHLAYVGAGVRA